MAMFVDGIPVAGGIPGVGIPKGGTDGQLLAKDGEKNYHGRWASPGDVALLPPKGYTGSPVTIPTRTTDILAPSWTGQTTVTGTPSPDSPATITGVPFAATATGPDGQTRSVDLGFTGYSLLDGTADSYDGVRGEFVQRVEKLVLDTIDVAYLYPAQRPAGSRTMMFSTKVISKQEELSLVCSHLPTRGVWNDDKEGAMAIGLGTYKRIAFSMLTSRLTAYGLVESDSTTHIPAIKAWFAAQAAAGTPVIVYYALAEPVAYNQKADLRAFDGQTTVTGVDTVDVIDGRIDRLAGYAYYEVVRSNPNLLDNWYFGEPINQRGQMQYSDATDIYGPDRWMVFANGALHLDGGYKITTGIFEKLPPSLIDHIIGKVVTCSILHNNGLFEHSFIVPKPTGSAVTRYKNDGTVNAGLRIVSNTNIRFQAVNSSGLETAHLYAAKLEFGPTQTLARKIGGQWVLNDPPPDPTLELLKCQRYQLAGASYVRLRASTLNAESMIFTLPIPVTMYKKPTIVMLERSSIKVQNGLSYSDSVDGFTFSVANMSHSSLSISALKQAHGLTDANLIMQNILLDANI